MIAIFMMKKKLLDCKEGCSNRNIVFLIIKMTQSLNGSYVGIDCRVLHVEARKHEAVLCNGEH